MLRTVIEGKGVRRATRITILVNNGRRNKFIKPTAGSTSSEATIVSLKERIMTWKPATVR